MKLYQLVNAEATINKISIVQLPLELGKKILPAFNQYTKIIRIYIRTRDQLFDRYGDPSCIDKREILLKHRPAYEKAYARLMGSSVGWDFEPVDISEFEGTLTLSLAELYIVSWLFR